MMDQYVLARLDALQQELERLRRAVAVQGSERPKRTTKLKGLWEGIDVTDEDLEEAKRAVFRDAYEFEG